VHILYLSRKHRRSSHPNRNIIARTKGTEFSIFSSRTPHTETAPILRNQVPSKQRYLHFSQATQLYHSPSNPHTRASKSCFPMARPSNVPQLPKSIHQTSPYPSKAAYPSPISFPTTSRSSLIRDKLSIS